MTLKQYDKPLTYNLTKLYSKFMNTRYKMLAFFPCQSLYYNVCDLMSNIGSNCRHVHVFAQDSLYMLLSLTKRFMGNRFSQLNVPLLFITSILRCKLISNIKVVIQVIYVTCIQLEFIFYKTMSFMYLFQQIKRMFCSVERKSVHYENVAIPRAVIYFQLRIDNMVTYNVLNRHVLNVV